MGVAAGEGAGAGGGVAAAGLLRGVQLVLLVARSQDWKCCWLLKLSPAQETGSKAAAAQHTELPAPKDDAIPAFAEHTPVITGCCTAGMLCAPFSDRPCAMSWPGGVFSSMAATLFMEAVGGVLRAVYGLVLANQALNLYSTIRRK